MTRALTVLGESDEGLGDEVDVALIDVEAEETQTPRRAAADAVQELQGLTHQVELGVALLPQVVLDKPTERHWNLFWIWLHSVFFGTSAEFGYTVFFRTSAEFGYTLSFLEPLLNLATLSFLEPLLNLATLGLF